MPASWPGRANPEWGVDSRLLRAGEERGVTAHGVGDLLLREPRRPGPQSHSGAVRLAGADPAWPQNVRAVLVQEEKGARGTGVCRPTRWPFTVSLSSQALGQAQAVTPHPQGEEGNHRDLYAAPGGQCLGPYLPRGGGSRSWF